MRPALSECSMSMPHIFLSATHMSLGGFMGSFIPFTLKKYGFDPASGSSVFATSVTDSGGFFIFLGLGSFFLS